MDPCRPQATLPSHACMRWWSVGPNRKGKPASATQACTTRAQLARSNRADIASPTAHERTWG
eukprot:1713662-Alexandrium_andersonii.AAC.1